MAMDTAWLKDHWYYVVGGLLGLFIVYELVHSISGASGSTSSTATDISGGANQLQSLQAAADLTDAQTNAQITTASYAADVANNQTAAALQLGEVTTAAELDASNHSTQASVDIAGINEGGQVQIATAQGADAVAAQQIVTNGQIQQTAIEGATIDTLGAQKATVALQSISDVNSQIQNIQTYSKNASKDYAAIAPVLAEETGQGTTVGAAKPTPGSTTAQNVSAVAGGISSILGGLFA